MPAQFQASKRQLQGQHGRSESSNGRAGEPPRRAPLVRITCRCSTEREYIDQYAGDVCARGIFLRTRAPMPIGTRVRFEVLLRGGRCALGGVGRVVWSRDADSELNGRAGFGVAFDRLRRGDRAFIERMIALRGNEPSRFEQPDISPSEPPQGAGLANALFDDVTLAAESEDDPSTAFLSADLSEELGQGPFRFASMRVPKRAEAERAIDLAEQLEPRAELADDAEDISVEVVLDPSAQSKRLRQAAAERAKPKLVSTAPTLTKASALLAADKPATHSTPAKPSARVTPVNAAPLNATAVKSALLNAAPTKAAAANAAPTKAAPAKAALANAAPMNAAAAKAVPVKAAPVKAGAVTAPSVKAAPVKARAVAAPSVKVAPVKAAPVKAAPVKAAPVKAASVKAAPVKAAPIAAIHTDSGVSSRPRATLAPGAPRSRSRTSTPPELRLLRSVPQAAVVPSAPPPPAPARGWTPAMTFLLMAVMLCASTVGYLALTGRLVTAFAH